MADIGRSNDCSNILNNEFFAKMSASGAVGSSTSKTFATNPIDDLSSRYKSELMVDLN